MKKIFKIFLPVSILFVALFFLAIYLHHQSIYYAKNNLGYIDTKGEIVIPPMYYSGSEFSGGLACAQKMKNRKPEIFAINKKNVVVFRYSYDRPFQAMPKFSYIVDISMTHCSYYSDGLLNVSDGYLGKNGEKVINLSPKEFDELEPFSEGLAAVHNKKTGWGYIDVKGDFVIPPQYCMAKSFHNGLAMVTEKKDDLYKSYFINPRNEKIISNIFGGCSFSEGIAYVWERQDNPAGKGFKEVPRFIGKDGRVVIDAEKHPSRVCRIDACNYFSEGLVAVKSSNSEKYGYMDKEGKMIIPPQYDDAMPFRNGLAFVEKDGAYSFIDKSGNVVFTENDGIRIPRFSSFSEDMAVIIKDGKYGYINTKGKIVIEPQFESAGPFSEGLAAVRIKNKSLWVNFFVNIQKAIWEIKGKGIAK